MLAVQCVVSPGGSARERHHALGHFRPERRNARRPRLVTQQPLEAFCCKALVPCQRHTQVLHLPVRRMISTVPMPSPLNKMTSARQTCFCGALRSLISAARRWRSRGDTVTKIPVRMRTTRTRNGKGNPNQDSYVRRIPLEGNLADSGSDPELDCTDHGEGSNWSNDTDLPQEGPRWHGHFWSSGQLVHSILKMASDLAAADGWRTLADRPSMNA